MQISSFVKRPFAKPFLIALGCLAGILLVLFGRSLNPDLVLFSNDGPLGWMMAEMNGLPANLTGTWQDIYWIGGESVSAAPHITALVLGIAKPLMFMKLYAPFSLLLLGLCVWICFRELGFSPAVCLLGGLAATLNMHSVSIACWGLGAWVISFAMMFLAIATLVSKSIKSGWVRGILAGTAVGMSLMEGFDVGAIDSLYIGIFGLFAGLVAEKVSLRTLSRSAFVILIVVVFAVLTAAHTISTLVGTQVKNVKIVEQDEKSKEERWVWATQWSLPKMELLRVLVPGIFGNRMDDGATPGPYRKSYWGAVGQTPGYEQHHQGMARHSGAGEYSGIFVLLVAVLAIAQSFRKQNSPFSPVEKRFVWFWSATALISLLLAFGRHAPFYQFLFALPYFSTVRNPIKFMHPFHVSLLILFGYGLESMVRRYLLTGSTKTAETGRPSFEKKWIISTVLLLGASVIGWMVYVSSEKKIVAYLTRFDFPAAIAPDIAKYSIGEVGWFVLFLAATVFLLTRILLGKFSKAPMLAFVLMSVVIVADLVHANLPWIIYYNYKEKYASNPVIDVLRNKPYEHRVLGMFPFRLNESLTMFQTYVYYTDWLQHQFPYYNVQSIDVAQEPRVSADNAAYRDALRQPNEAQLASATTQEQRMEMFNARIRGEIRLWQLTNVRYVFGLASGFDQFLNQQIADGSNHFRVHTIFGLSQDGVRYVVQTNDTGPFALLEFTGALPRVKLYQNWQTVTNDEVVLAQLANPSFNPFQTVLVHSPSISASTNVAAESGSVKITNYHPKKIDLSAEVKAASILLMNDKYDSQWKVFVDGKETPLLRCNYIMRGIQLEPGQHEIQFRFKPPVQNLYISLASGLFGLGVLGFVLFTNNRKSTATVSSS